jgi:hypothetical protein
VASAQFWHRHSAAHSDGPLTTAYRRTIQGVESTLCMLNVV